MIFDFYSVLKNEDAPPFIGENLLVAADGLGGAGGYIHKIDYEKHPDMRGDILDAAYGDFDSETRARLDAYLNELVEPMADDKPDTSALWGSRIVIGRFVYAMLNGSIPKVNEVNCSPKEEEKSEECSDKHCEMSDADSSEVSIVASDAEEAPASEPNEEKAEEAPASEPNEEKAEEVPASEPNEEKAEEAPASEPAEEKAEEVPASEPNEEKKRRGFFGLGKKDKTDKVESVNLDISNPSHREILSDFISLGLVRVADKFSLLKSDISGQLLLPTTLTAIRFNEKKDCVEAECIWAGDSRCYALCPDGLKLLSEDDEDESGAITNLFYIGSKKAVIHYRRYEISKPCVLMTVSDGFFDPFGDEEYLGVEYTFQKCLLESDSVDNLRDRLLTEFDGIRGDDTTVAFQAFGFKDFEDMKQILKPRAESVVATANKWKELRTAIELADLPESEVNGYITTRTSDKYMSITPILTQMLIEGKDDIVLSPSIKARVEAKRNELKRERKIERQNRKKDGLNDVYVTLRDNPEKISYILSPVCPIPELAEKWRDLFAKSEKISRNNRSIEDNTKKLDEVERKYKSFGERLESMAQRRYQEIREMVKSPRGEADYKRWTQLRREEVLWGAVEYAYTHNMKFSKLYELLKDSLPLNVQIYKKDERDHKNNKDLLSDLQRTQQHREEITNQINQARQALNDNKRNYIRLLDEIFNIIRSSNNIAGFFKENFARQFGLILSELNDDDAAAKLDGAIKSMFLSQKNEIVGEIVAALAENYDKTSVIDSMYNGTRLTRFRDYYKYRKCMSDEAIGAVRNELKKLEKEYYSMLRSDAT